MGPRVEAAARSRILHFRSDRTHCFRDEVPLSRPCVGRYRSIDRLNRPTTIEKKNMATDRHPPSRADAREPSERGIMSKEFEMEEYIRTRLGTWRG